MRQTSDNVMILKLKLGVANTMKKQMHCIFHMDSLGQRICDSPNDEPVSNAECTMVMFDTRLTHKFSLFLVFFVTLFFYIRSLGQRAKERYARVSIALFHF